MGHFLDQGRGGAYQYRGHLDLRVVFKISVKLFKIVVDFLMSISHFRKHFSKS